MLCRKDRLLMQPEVYSCLYSSPVLVSVIPQMNSVHTSDLFLRDWPYCQIPSFRLHLTPKRALHFKFPDWNSV